MAVGGSDAPNMFKRSRPDHHELAAGAHACVGECKLRWALCGTQRLSPAS